MIELFLKPCFEFAWVLLGGTNISDVHAIVQGGNQLGIGNGN